MKTQQMMGTAKNVHMVGVETSVLAYILNHHQERIFIIIHSSTHTKILPYTLNHHSERIFIIMPSSTQKKVPQPPASLLRITGLKLFYCSGTSRLHERVVCFPTTVFLLLSVSVSSIYYYCSSLTSIQKYWFYKTLEKTLFNTFLSV